MPESSPHKTHTAALVSLQALGASYERRTLLDKEVTVTSGHLWDDGAFLTGKVGKVEDYETAGATVAAKRREACGEYDIQTYEPRFSEVAE